KSFQELRRGAVKQRPPESLTPCDDLDQTALEQLVDHRARVDAADLVDLDTPDRLPVGDDGQRLERRGTQTPRTQRELRALDRLGVLAAGEELPSVADRDELDAVLPSGEGLSDLAERRLNGLRARLGVEGEQLLDREGPRRGEQRRFNQLREGTHGGSGWARTVRPGGPRGRPASQARAARRTPTAYPRWWAGPRPPRATRTRSCGYSSSRRTSAARGSSHSSSPTRRGRSICALMRSSRAAISG